MEATCSTHPGPEATARTTPTINADSATTAAPTTVTPETGDPEAAQGPMIDVLPTVTPPKGAQIATAAMAATDIAITEMAAAATNSHIEPPEHHMRPRTPATTAQRLKMHRHVWTTAVFPIRNNALSL